MGLGLSKQTSPIIAFLLAAVFGFAAFAKVRAIEQFQLTLQRDLYMSGALAAPLSICLILAETIVVIALLAPVWRSIGLYGSMIMSCLFMAFGFWKWWSGVTAPCTCFGLLLTMAPPQSMALSASVFVGSIVGLRSTEMIVSQGRSS